MTGAHAERAHAKLSASGSKRWLTCTPSVRLESGFEDKTSSFAEEGTAAHELSELMLAYELKDINKATYTRRLNKFTKENQYYSQEMMDYVEGYVDYVMERVNAMRARTEDALVLIEQRLDFSEWVPEGFGTGDVLLIGDGLLEIIDLKYGKGVEVTAHANTQMMLYGLGALNAHDLLYDIEQVLMTIVQPRLDAISTYEMSAVTLYDWAEKVIKPKAELAINGEGEFIPGEHCRFCKAKAVCRARADENLAIAKEEFTDPDMLTPEEIADILFRTKEMQKWAKDVEEYALDQAENFGVKFDGWKLVEGRSNRKYANDEVVYDRLAESEQDMTKVTETKLLSITNMEKVLGKATFNELLSDVIIKPSGKPTLVVATDKRPELNTAESAADEFDEITE
ncbi:DUF2800 domain-containing protein [Psychrobacillus psychrodurans]|uniref:DUF2800 domain-containing protein n=1 Tax=Psychrobacillus psychrodurans TaxID=126157 RepID=UPI001F4DAD34|nr:DUF2800 domain-containing protein [Psychrobacillus psychrodurans]MCK1996827.1 DUF2800 domain-containing protein [Psychrobacillus psychrodurans]